MDQSQQVEKVASNVKKIVEVGREIYTDTNHTIFEVSLGESVYRTRPFPGLTKPAEGQKPGDPSIRMFRQQLGFFSLYKPEEKEKGPTTAPPSAGKGRNNGRKKVKK